MKNSDVQMGATYMVKVANNLVPVKITGNLPTSGWEGTSEKTGKTIRIKSAQRLRRRVAASTPIAPDPADGVSVDAERDTSGQGATNARPCGAKEMSLIDAAAQILSEANAPMRCKDLVDLVVKRELWTPRTGKTPASTLYAAILREITTKGDACRFVKTERGKFALKDSRYIREQAAKAARQK